MGESRVAEPVGYHLFFEDGRDDPDGAQHPDGSHRQGGDSRQLSRWQRTDLSNMPGKKLPHILRGKFPSVSFW